MDSGWYPKGVASDAERRLRYYAGRFPIVELDASYYAIPDPAQSRRWAERTPDGFTMNVKAFATITGHPAETARLPRDIREALPVAAAAKRRLYPKDFPDDLLLEVHARFWIALAPLRAAGKLGAILLQFPDWFLPSNASLAAIERIRDLLPDDRLAVELRSGAWLAGNERLGTMRFLRDRGLTFVAVDEPQGFRSSVPPVAEVTAPELAIVRFHGRNAETWEQRGITAAQRFNYLYSERELEAWVPAIRRLESDAEEVHLLMNNCFEDKAVRNAEQLMVMLRAS